MKNLLNNGSMTMKFHILAVHEGLGGHSSPFRSSDKQTRTSYKFACTLRVIQAAEEFLVFIGWG